MDKKNLRKFVRNELSKIPQKLYTIHSQMIHNKLLNMSEVKQAKTIAITISHYPEVDTIDLIEQLWKLGKNVAIPKCKHETKQMDFYIFTSFDELEVVFKQLQEPIVEQTTKIEKEMIDVLIAPGIAFDLAGYRVGFGGGYYDRFLVDFDKPTISMAFEVQIVDKIPTDGYDLAICKIVTEERIITCNNV
ncbi:5-formyltetrahydrofolate cyclo-ligase [Kurthia sibirica]|uniref:5-formyltetrahydrofolate cyclo-ligase n=1 Tax=Kurthia sibirica TaxID=202750 RepID=A0A2U3AM27_9BACL|nr:5-formyltetrahydrofolate cyclo-ligase [Kurthia sibirica]PWI25547.1 5-formyltetrahydrofolate cyclo-ligase [Kurthia sibirica]GEK33924.1 hypothetical protein KSI01_14570 [Kurthia sibirica]